ncbi:MAG: cytidine deaminase [Sphingobacteriales bacterium]|nr:MAG: cytidine deaminase [Sphingobacteriales bacterium]
MAKFQFEYTVTDEVHHLPPEEKELVQAAFDAAKDLAYAPYSEFKVGAAVRLASGTIIKGSNQENAAFPAGICAERVALSAVSVLHPGEKILTIAIAYQKDNIPEAMAHTVLSPCGTCRQSIAEYIARQQQPIALLLCSATGPVYRIENAMQLLPFSFGSEML